MNSHEKAALAVIAAVLAVIAVLAFTLGGGTHRHATCWAKPGVINHRVDGKWAPTYTPAGTRHGRGHIPGVCNG
jgi:hypothetical protein